MYIHTFVQEPTTYENLNTFQLNVSCSPTKSAKVWDTGARPVESILWTYLQHACLI